MKCNQSGVCCKLFLINLDEEEYKSKQFQTVFEEHIENWKEAEEYGAHFLKQKKDGSCIYLKDNLCSIHNERPKVCREFFCASSNPKFKEMVTKVNEYKTKHNLKILKQE